jgi:hypothetical protein
MKYQSTTRRMMLSTALLVAIISSIVYPSIAIGAAGPEPTGWYAGDMHVHRSCGGSPQDVSSMYQLMGPQGLTFMSLLADMGSGEVQNAVTDLPLVNGQDTSISTSSQVLHWDSEWHWDATYTQYPHQALGGHVVALGLAEAHQIWDEYTYPIFNWAHQQNAIAGFVHMQYLDNNIPQSLNCCIPIEYPVEVALGAADFIEEDVNGGEPAMQAYYRLLNCGFRPGFAAGTDYPCGVSEVGSLLTYVQTAGGQMTYRNWIDGIANGRTVVSRNGHNEFLSLTVNNSATPGDEVKLTTGGSVPVTITWTASQDLSGTIELVQNGVVVASQAASAGPGVPATLSTTVNFANSGWLVARRMDSNKGHIVHTAAVFVTVNNAPVRASAADADFYVQWMDNLLSKTSPGGEWNAYFPSSLAAAQARYSAAKALFQQIGSEAGGSPSRTLSSLSLTPANQTILAGNTQQLIATGTYSDGSTLNITAQAGWTSSNTGVASANRNGLALAVSPGTTTVSAMLSGITGSTTLNVQPNLLSIATTSLSDGVTNISYAAVLAANGGTTPYTWSISSGSLPPGLLLDTVTGSISGTPAAVGAFSFTVQVSDSSSPTQTRTQDLSITVAAPVVFTLWPSTTVPDIVDAGPDKAVELGVKFRSDSSGYITGIRFYKASDNTDTHVGNLWTGTGTLLATATFANETDSGWQQVNFSAPVAITANTVYVASYFTGIGHYSFDGSYFSGKGMDSPPLHALADGVSGGNGVYAYGSTSSFPNQNYNSGNYWVDAVFSYTPPTLYSISVTPASQAISIGATQQFAATGTYSDGGAQNLTSQVTWASSSTSVVAINSAGLATAVGPGTTTLSATMNSITGSTSLTVLPGPLAMTTLLVPDGILNVPYAVALQASGGAPPYGWSVSSGSLPAGLTLDSHTGAITGTPAAAGTFSSFMVQLTDSGIPAQTATKLLNISVGSSGSILIVSSALNSFSTYYSEILRTEGFSEFAVSDISSISSAMLASYDIVILGDMSLTPEQVAMFNDWVNAGGHLIAMRPDKKLAGLLGLSDQSSTLANAFLLVNTSSGPGAGIVDQTIQYHGTADLYGMNGAITIATLYSGATTSSPNPAVTLNRVGPNGGQAAAFTYDLARSIVYTRQGNPAWAGQMRDGQAPIRSDDLFYGNASFDPQPDWVDMNIEMNKLAIPQADEQQRLLANLIIQMNFNKKPLPRFWYLPRSLAAAVIMTGDDHGALYDAGASAARFDRYLAASPQGCSVDNWECVRGTAYLIAPSVGSNPLTNDMAAAYIDSGFEISVHVDTDPDCSDWTPASLDAAYTDNLNSFISVYTNVPAPRTHRMHCVSWSDYDSQPKTELNHGIRLDTNYYTYPPAWISNHPGFITGSGMPMRFADVNGNLIDVYQAATQMTDESGQFYPYTIDTLLDNAIGPTGYYGVFTANIHADSGSSTESDAIVSSAMARGIPVISARQMLTWLDGRNASTFSSLSRNGNTLSFSINVGQGANGLIAMVPVADTQTVTGLTYNGSPLSFETTRKKGIQYASFLAANGDYQITFVPNEDQAITFDSLPIKTYGNDDFAPGATTSSGLQIAYASSNSSVATIVAGNIHIVGAGTTTITASQPGNEKYAPAVPVAQVLSVTAAVLTITADAKSRTYGDSDPQLTYQVTKGSLVGADALTGVLSRASGENIGTYAIQQGTLSAGGNYDLTYVGANLVITRRDATVAASDASKVYGDAEPSLTATVSGFVAADGITAGVSRAAGESAGTYMITPAATDGGSGKLANYNITLTAGTFTITKANQAISFSSLTSKIYGMPDFAAGATASSNLPVSYMSSNPSVATINAEGMIHIVSAGTTTITAAQAGNINYNAAVPVEQLLAVIIPAATVSPATLSFGDQVIRTVSPLQTVTVSNTGTGPLTISSISMAGMNPGQFSQTNDCPATVAPGAFCTVSATFAPTTTGARSASISVNVAAPGVSKSVPLSGTGTSPVLSVSPATLSFGDQVIRTVSPLQTVTVSNTGTGPLTISSISMVGMNPGQFSQTNDCPATVAPGAFCTVSVTFAPTTTGAKSASISVNVAAPGVSKAITLSGTAQ